MDKMFHIFHEKMKKYLERKLNILPLQGKNVMDL